MAPPEKPPASPASSLALFSRRNVMRGGIGGAVLLGLGGVGLALQSSRREDVDPGALRVLTLDEHAVLAAVARCVCPAPGPDVPGPDAVGVGVLADRLLATQDPATVSDVKAVLALFESGLTGAIFLERVRPFTQLDPADQRRVFVGWRDSSVLLRRTVARALAALAASLYYGDPRVWPGVGYPGPPDPAALRRAYAAQLVELDALRAPGHEIEEGA